VTCLGVSETGCQDGEGAFRAPRSGRVGRRIDAATGRTPWALASHASDWRRPSGTADRTLAPATAEFVEIATDVGEQLAAMIRDVVPVPAAT
jgi:hypothetical protein